MECMYGRCTGIFQSGGIGLARLSLARYGVASFTPGMAVKVFVKDQPSLNFHVGHGCPFLLHAPYHHAVVLNSVSSACDQRRWCITCQDAVVHSVICAAR